MNSTDVFDYLLEHRKIALETSKKNANVLRVALVRKFSDYKEQMSRLGFLDPELEIASLSLEYDEESGAARYFLRPKKVSSLTFTILQESDGEPNAS
jgi:hypothetical protein